MSIVTDALNRLQADRAQSATSATSSDPTSPVISIFSRSPHQPAVASTPILRQVFKGLALILVLGLIGISAYLWSLTMVPTAPESPTLPIVDSIGMEALPPTANGEESGLDEVEIAPTSDPSNALTESPPKRTTEEQPAFKNRETSARTPIVPLQSKTPMAKQGPVVSKPVQASRLRELAPPSTTSSPKKKPAEAGTMSPDPTQRREQALTKNQVSSDRSPRVPSGRTVLEQRLSLVKQLIDRKRYGQVLTLLQPLFVNPPKEWEVWFWRGTAHLGLGQLAEAEDAFVEGLARDSTIPHLWVQRALVSQQRGHFGEAVESLRQAELLGPELPEVQLNLGYSLEVRGDVKAAVEHYQTYLTLTEGKHTYQSARKKVFHRIVQLQHS